MAKPVYNIIAKVTCDECTNNIRNKKKLDTRCPNCTFVKYRNFYALDIVPFLNKKFPNWTWVNVYENIKGKKGPKLQSYVKGKSEPTGIRIS